MSSTVLEDTSTNQQRQQSNRAVQQTVEQQVQARLKGVETQLDSVIQTATRSAAAYAQRSGTVQFSAAEQTGLVNGTVDAVVEQVGAGMNAEQRAALKSYLSDTIKHSLKGSMADLERKRARAPIEIDDSPRPRSSASALRQPQAGASAQEQVGSNALPSDLSQPQATELGQSQPQAQPGAQPQALRNPLTNPTGQQAFSANELAQLLAGRQIGEQAQPQQSPQADAIPLRQSATSLRGLPQAQTASVQELRNAISVTLEKEVPGPLDTVRKALAGQKVENPFESMPLKSTSTENLRLEHATTAGNFLLQAEQYGVGTFGRFLRTAA